MVTGCSIDDEDRLMTELHVHVFGGLASRLRVVAAAIGYCELHKMRLVVCWPRREPNFTRENTGLAEDGVFDAWLSDLFDGPFREERMESRSEMAPTNRILSRSMSGGSRVRTCHPSVLEPWTFPEPVSAYFRRLRPTAMVKGFVDEMDSAFQNASRPLVGIHVRKTHSQPDAQHEGWYAARMLEMISVNSDVSFFLSCDDESVTKMLLAPDRVIAQNKSFRYDREGIARSAADLYLLASCDWILGSCMSSFSVLADWLQSGGPPPDDWIPGVDYKDAWHNWLHGDCYEDAWFKPNDEKFAKVFSTK